MRIIIVEEHFEHPDVSQQVPEVRRPARQRRSTVPHLTGQFCRSANSVTNRSMNSFSGARPAGRMTNFVRPASR